MADHDRLLSSPETFVFWGSPKANEIELRKTFEKKADDEKDEDTHADESSSSSPKSLYNLLPSVTFSPLSSKLGMFMSNEARIERAFSPPPPSPLKPSPLRTEIDNELDDSCSAEQAATAVESSPQAKNTNVESDRDEAVVSDIEIIMDDAGATVQSQMLEHEDKIAEETNIIEQIYDPPPPTPPQIPKLENNAVEETKKPERPAKANPRAIKPTGIPKIAHKHDHSKIPISRPIPKAKAPPPSRLLQTLQHTRSIRTVKAASTQPKVVQNSKQTPADRSKPPPKLEVPPPPLPPPPPPPTMSDLHFSNQLHVKPIEHSIKPSPLPREKAFVSEGGLIRENAMIWEGPPLLLSLPPTSPVPPPRRNIFSDLPPLSNLSSKTTVNQTGNKRTRALLADRKLATPPPPPARNLRKRPSPNIANKENAPSVLRRTDSTKDAIKAEITSTEVPPIISTSTVSTVPKKSSLKRQAPTDDVQDQLTAKELMLTTRRNTARNREYYSAIHKIIVHKNEKRPPSPSAKIKKKMGKGQATRQALGNRKLGTMVPSAEDQQMHISDSSSDGARADEHTDEPPRKRVKWSKDVILNTPEKKQKIENTIEPPKSLMKRHRLPILDQYGNASNAAASLSPLLGRKPIVTVTKHVYIDDPVDA